MTQTSTRQAFHNLSPSTTHSPNPGPNPPIQDPSIQNPRHGTASDSDKTPAPESVAYCTSAAEPATFTQTGLDDGRSGGFALGQLTCYGEV